MTVSMAGLQAGARVSRRVEPTIEVRTRIAQARQPDAADYRRPGDRPRAPEIMPFRSAERERATPWRHLDSSPGLTHFSPRRRLFGRIMRMQPVTAAELEQHCRQAGWVRALARRLCADAAAADDLVQDAWTHALERPGPEPGRFRQWFAAVLRNHARSLRRAAARRARREAWSTPPEGDGDPALLAARLEAQRELAAAVRELDEPYRTAILLRYFEGLAPRAIAARTGTPVRTVHTRLGRALGMLRVSTHGMTASGTRGCRSCCRSSHPIDPFRCWSPSCRTT
jgi:RNA polymerase sigma-70 factor (ECF subfamily)